MRATAVTDKMLCLWVGTLRHRLSVNHGSHMPMQPDNKHSRCALHHWGAKTRTRAHILKCNTCSIHLCIDCFAKFHTVQEVNELKGLFSQEETVLGSNKELTMTTQQQQSILWRKIRPRCNKGHHKQQHSKTENSVSHESWKQQLHPNRQRNLLLIKEQSLRLLS